MVRIIVELGSLIERRRSSRVETDGREMMEARRDDLT